MTRILSHTERIHIDPGSYLNEQDGLWYPIVSVRWPLVMGGNVDEYTKDEGYTSAEAAKPAALAMAEHIRSVILENTKDGITLPPPPQN